MRRSGGLWGGMDINHTSCRAGLLLSLMLGLFNTSTSAQPPERSNKTSDSVTESRTNQPTKTILEQLKERYPDVEEAVISRLEGVIDGPADRIVIRGKIAPPRDVAGAPAEERASRAAIAFIEEEAEILGIKPSELKEVSGAASQRATRTFPGRSEAGLKHKESLDTPSDKGARKVSFVQTVAGLPLLGTQLSVDVDEEGSIQRVDGMIRPVSAELREAAAHTMKNRQEVAQLVEKDLLMGHSAEKIHINTDARKLATWREPYVIWAVGASRAGKPAWSYTVNAFTGEILARNCTARSFIQVGSVTPCD